MQFAGGRLNLRGVDGSSPLIRLVRPTAVREMRPKHKEFACETKKVSQALFWVAQCNTYPSGAPLGPTRAHAPNLG